MWLDETVSPSTSDQRRPRASRTRCARAASRPCPSRPCRSGSSRRPTPARRRACRSAPRRRTPRRSSTAKSSSNGITTSSSTPEPGDEVALDGERRDQLRRGLGVDDRQRVRIEGQHRVAPRITSRWPTCTPSNVPTATRRGRADSTSGSEVTFMPARTLRRASARHRAARRSRACSPRASAGRARPEPTPRDIAPPVPHGRGLVAVELALGQERERLAQRHDSLGVRRPRARTARSPCARAPRSTRRPGPRPASARTCRTSTRSRSSARSPSCQSEVRR